MQKPFGPSQHVKEKDGLIIWSHFPPSAWTLCTKRPRLASWLAKEMSEICTAGDVLVNNWHSQRDYSQSQSFQTQAHASVVFLHSFLLSFPGEHYTPFLLFRTTLLVPVLNAELLTD